MRHMLSISVRPWFSSVVSACCHAREEMTPVAHGVFDELVSNDVEPGSPQHLQVGVGVEVAPEHRSAQPTLRIVVFGNIACTEAEESDAAGHENAPELVEDRSVLGT